MHECAVLLKADPIAQDIQVFEVKLKYIGRAQLMHELPLKKGLSSGQKGNPCV